MKKSILIGLMGAMLCGSPLWAAEILKQDKDIKSGVGYTVVQDDNTLTFAFDFSGPMRLMQLAQNGFNLYLNEKGNKSETIGVSILPFRPEPKKGHPGEGGQQPPLPADRETNSPGKDNTGKNQVPDVKFTSAYWIENKDSVFLDMSEPDSVLKAYFDCTDDKYRCVVVVPIKLINAGGLKKPDKLMVGLLSKNTVAMMPPMRKSGDGDDGGMPDMGNAPGGMPPGGGMPGGGGNMGRGGGGPGGPGGPGGGQGGPGRAPGNVSSQTQGTSNEIKLWFNCK